jgi:RNA polymerase sigma-70 factor, ECF subfamily
MRENGRGERDDQGSSADEAVVARVLVGDHDAFSLLVRRHQASLYRYALGMVGSDDLAADVVQDSFVKAFASLAQCKEPRRFGAWMLRIVRNRCLDHLKRSRRVSRIDDVEFELEAAGSADDELRREELRRALDLALGELPVAQRDAFLLKHLQEISYEEMAEMLGASVSALKMRVMRAREALRQVLVERL